MLVAQLGLSVVAPLALKKVVLRFEIYVCQV